MTIELGQRLATGSRSAVFALGADAVAKVPLPSTPDSWIVEEARFADAVSAVGAPVPRLLGVEVLDGRQVSVYERIWGRSMLEHLRDQPASVAAHAATLAELHASLFALAPPPVVLPRLVDRLTSKIRGAASRHGDELLAALDELPDDRRAVVCHGDLHPGNVLLAASGAVVIDWFDAGCGPPAADVARTSLLLSPECHGPSGVAHLPGLDVATLDTLRRAYLDDVQSAAGVDLAAVSSWTGAIEVARLAEGVEPDGVLRRRALRSA